MVGRMMRTGLATAALVAVCGAGAYAQENPFRWSGKMSAGQTLEVKGISGDIHTELASGSTAEVVAEKHGRSGDFDRVEIRVVQEGDGVTVCAVYRPEDHPDGCDMRDNGNRHRRHNDNIRVSVDFTAAPTCRPPRSPATCRCPPPARAGAPR
jgi:hypothetical protein